MIGSRLSWRIFGAFAVVLLVVTTASFVWLHGHVEGALLGQLEGQMGAQSRELASAARGWLASPDGERSTEEATLTAARIGSRITLLDSAGRALYDSQIDPSRLGDETRLAEVAGALAGGHAWLTRRSLVSARTMAYEARRIEASDGTVLGVLRLAAPLDEIDAVLAGLRTRLVWAAVLAAFVAVVLARAVARSVATPLVELTDVAEALRSGQLARRVPEPGHDETGRLGATLNRLGDALSERIAAISDDDARLRAMLAAMVEGVIAVDGDDRIVFSNHAACELLGIEEGEAIGRPMWQLLRAAELVRLLEEAHAHGHVVQREIQLQRHGREYVLEAHVSPFDGGVSDGLVIVLHDVSELRRLERVRRDFVANVSHELKTPLTSIKGYVETLLEGALHDERNNVRFLEKIAVHVERLSHLVTDLLSLARIESQQGALPREPIDAIPIVQRALRRYDEAARAKDISLRFEGERAPVVVLGDPEALTQVIDNLLDNAIKYTPGAGMIAVRVERLGAMGRISVTDSGIGISDEDQERIFERFYRVDKARSREVGGTGLGLSIVKHLVQAMQGTVQVESRLHEGSRFSVDLPLTRPSAARPAPPAVGGTTAS